MKTALGAACAVLFALSLSPRAHAQSVQPDFTNCRGVNYVVSGRINPIDQWLFYDATAVENNLNTLDNFGVNAVRVFSSFLVWRDSGDREAYKDNLRDLARKVFERDMMLMLVLFDSYGADPDVFSPGWTLPLLASTTGWFKSPEPSYFPLSGQPEITQYITDVLTTIEEAEALAMKSALIIYDMWNEPAAGVDDEIETQASIARGYTVGRPIVASEAVSHGAGQDYAHILRWLDPSDPKFISYYPAAYEFTVAESQDLMLNWDVAYSSETYSQTPLNAYYAGLAAEPDNFDNRAVDFYSRIQGLAEASGTKLDPFVGTEQADWDALQMTLQGAIAAAGAMIANFPGHWSIPGLIGNIDQAFSDSAAFLWLQWVQPFATDTGNSPSEIVYLNGWWETVVAPSGPPLAQIQFHVEMLVNDADRLSDIQFKDIAYSSDGGETYTSFSLNTTDFNSTAYLGGNFNLPPLPPGQKYRIRGQVADSAAAPGEVSDQLVKVVPGP